MVVQKISYGCPKKILWLSDKKSFGCPERMLWSSEKNLMVYEIQTTIRLMIETWMIVLWMIVSYPFKSYDKSIDPFETYTEDTSLASLGVCCGLRRIRISGKARGAEKRRNGRMCIMKEPPILCQHCHWLTDKAKTKSMTNKLESWWLIPASIGAGKGGGRRRTHWGFHSKLL